MVVAGEFTIGSDDPKSMLNERPAHAVRLDGFWMDEHDVTNFEFRRFVEATGYITTAEKPIDWTEMQKQVAPGTPSRPRKCSNPARLFSRRQIIRLICVT